MQQKEETLIARRNKRNLNYIWKDIFPMISFRGIEKKLAFKWLFDVEGRIYSDFVLRHHQSGQVVQVTKVPMLSKLQQESPDTQEWPCPSNFSLRTRHETSFSSMKIQNAGTFSSEAPRVLDRFLRRNLWSSLRLY